mmetsp:Transcript_35794/g.76335  ORF Transcript_35794/g.76335 Transcript_35794/m.76335 type:complete len:583 (+) Transcript_35794:2639-4387(+)
MLREALPHEGAATAAYDFHEVGVQPVLVFRQKFPCAVLHRPREVLDHEAVVMEPHSLKDLALAMACGELPAPGLVRTTRNAAFIVKHREDTGTGVDAISRKELHDILVVGEILCRPLDALAEVERSLVLEDHLIEALLEKLVREVDAELLEGVTRQALKAKDVEDADEWQRRCIGVAAAAFPVVAQYGVDAPHHEGEDGAVEVPRERVTALHCLVDALDLKHPLLGHPHGPPAEGHVQARHLHVEEAGHRSQGAASLASTGAFRASSVVGGRTEGHVAQVEHRRHHREELGGLCFRHAEGTQRAEGLIEGGCLVLAPNGGARRLGQVPEVTHAELADATQLHALVPQEHVGANDCRAAARDPTAPVLPRTCGCGQELVEDVKAALALMHSRNAHLLEQVGTSAGAYKARGSGIGAASQGLRPLELQLHVLPEAGGVVVPQRLRIAECLEQRDGLQDPALYRQRGFHTHTGAAVAGTSACQVLKGVLCGLRLPGTALPGYEHGLRGTSAAHTLVGSSCHTVDVRRALWGILCEPMQLLGAVQARDAPKWIHCQQHGSGEGVDHAGSETDLERMEHLRLTQEDH